MGRILSLLIAILLFSSLFIGVMHIYGDLINHYPEHYENNEADIYYGEVFQQINESFDLTQSMSNKIRNQTSTETTAWDSAILGTTSMSRLIWNSFNMANKMVQAIAQELSLPVWLVTTIMTLILLTIVITLASAFLRYDL